MGKRSGEKRGREVEEGEGGVRGVKREREGKRSGGEEEGWIKEYAK